MLQAWLKKRTTQEATVFQSLYDKIFEDVYTYMKLSLNPKMQLLECNYIVQVSFLFLFLVVLLDLRFFFPTQL